MASIELQLFTGPAFAPIRAELVRLLGELASGQCSLDDARRDLSRHIKPVRHMPALEECGGINDIRVQERTDLILETGLAMRQGRRDYLVKVADALRDPDIASMYPADELHAAGSESMIGRLNRRWLDCGGVLRDGRMIAPRYAPVWTAFSIYDLPHEPFDLPTHGINLSAVDIQEAEKFGITEMHSPRSHHRLPEIPLFWFDIVPPSPSEQTLEALVEHFSRVLPSEDEFED